MAVTKQVKDEFSCHLVHVILECTLCSHAQHSFLTDEFKVHEEWLDFRLRHVLCSGDEVDVVTGEPIG